MSSGAFAYNTQQDNMMKNFLDDNIAHADSLTVSDIRKALPFMSEEAAREMLVNMKKFLVEQKMRNMM